MLAGCGHAACAIAQNDVKAAALTNHAGRTEPPSIIEPPRAAEVTAAGNEKTQPLVRRLGKSDADAFADGLDLVTIVADPKLLVGKQIQTVVQQVDPQCRSQPPRAPRQIRRLDMAYVTLHMFDAEQRLERPQQHAGTNSARFTRYI